VISNIIRVLVACSGCRHEKSQPCGSVPNFEPAFELLVTDGLVS